MATVKEIAADIKDTYGTSIINAAQAAEYLGMSRNKRGEFLASIPVYVTGRNKKYHALDIARRLDVEEDKDGKGADADERRRSGGFVA